MKKKFLFSFFVIIFIFSLISALSFEDLDKAIEYSVNDNCSITIEILEDNCNDFYLDDYREAQCHFALGYCYYQDFLTRQILIIEDSEGMQGVCLKEDLILINKSIEHYNKAINLSWCNLTDKDLRENEKSSILISSLIMNSDNYISINEYDNAEKLLNHLSIILSLKIDSLKLNLDQLNRVKIMYEKLYSAIPKKVEVELTGDLNPLSYSQPEIKPEIILESKEDSGIKLLYVEYENLNGFNSDEIESNNSQFVFNKKLILHKKNKFLFPFDSFYSEIYNIQPSRIQNKSIQISIIGESPNIQGTAKFDKDKIQLEFKRKTSYSIEILTSFLILIVSLTLFNKKMKSMDKKDFQPTNLIRSWEFFIPLASLAFFIIKGFNSIFNLLSIIIIIYLIFTSFKFYKKRKRLFNQRNSHLK